MADSDLSPEDMALLLDHYRRAQAMGAGQPASAPAGGGMTPDERAALQAQQRTAWALDPNNVTALAQQYAHPGAADERARQQAATATFKAEDKSKAAQQSMGLSDRDRSAYQTFLEEDAAKQRSLQTLTPDQLAAVRMAQANAAAANNMAAQARVAIPYRGPSPQIMAASDRRLKTRVEPATAGLRQFLNAWGCRRG